MSNSLVRPLSLYRKAKDSCPHSTKKKYKQTVKHENSAATVPVYLEYEYYFIVDVCLKCKKKWYVDYVKKVI